ncbi:chitin synthase-domain-containing protein [Endogone sp. FLAS-F59071]|nr:chitin synthase-domain-containing protein [Endogone sp. FLAS-F59071]|eukprot:RUS19780.1 chitin synthase-domain-containing protein [Endogone sp. FLAS-F59071]
MPTVQYSDAVGSGGPGERGGSLHRGPSVGHGLRRGKTLTRPERYQQPAPLLTGEQTHSTVWEPWPLFAKLITFWAPPPLLRYLGKSDKGMQQAWREKITLCFLIALLGGAVSFLTVGLSLTLCPPSVAANQVNYLAYGDVGNSAGMLGIQGWAFNVSASIPTKKVNFYTIAQIPGTDITDYFANVGTGIAACNNPQDMVILKYSAVTFDPCANKGTSNTTCSLLPLTPTNLLHYNLVNTTQNIGYDWDQLADPLLTNWLVIDGNVLNFDPYMNAYPDPIPGDDLDATIRNVLASTAAGGGKDATKAFFRRDDLKASTNCITQKYYAGHLDKSTPGCFAASLFLYVSLVVILGIVFSRFFVALVFAWFISWKLSRTPAPLPKAKPAPGQQQLSPDQPAVPPALIQRTPQHNQIELHHMRLNSKTAPWAPQRVDMSSFPGNAGLGRPGGPEIGHDLFTLMLVTCYSEGEASLRCTIESLANTQYRDDRKLLFVIADGMITGSGNSMSTPDICVEMMEFDSERARNPEPQSYIAVAQGSKQHNMAKVYAGHFVHNDHRVPMILVAKCGTPEEADKPKPGNRGKRDSQLILMNFFSRVTYNDRMCPLDYELFRTIQALMGVTPDYFEIVLMVDADTMVYPDSLRLLVNCMINDPLIMGLCGETKIANKRDSWVTMIQVYEYYISHHLGKGFESIFGGVTCLPGCFCMYRLKARKSYDDWVPILTKPEIVHEYSQNTVDTLHQKNLLLLGEDRFLTTLMLRNFPHRKMMFTPHAVCKTVVPDEFKVLLSQRRRWINSTIHNLLELVLVRNLCGTFCFSMQFVIFMDLIGTLVLPVAMILTVVLVISIIKTHITSFVLAVPLILLLLVLFSPGLLILLTTRKWVYVMWMGVYLCALPIWNFVLPVYAYWHFDDFSWGETRKVTGETKGDDHGKKEGAFDASKIPMQRWEYYEKHRIRMAKRMDRKRRTQAAVANGMAHPVLQDVIQDEQRLLHNPSPSNSEVGSKYSMDGSEFGPPQTVWESREGTGRAISGYYPNFVPPTEDPGQPGSGGRAISGYYPSFSPPTEDPEPIRGMSPTQSTRSLSPLIQQPGYHSPPMPSRPPVSGPGPMRSHYTQIGSPPMSQPMMSPPMRNQQRNIPPQGGPQGPVQSPRSPPPNSPPHGQGYSPVSPTSPQEYFPRSPPPKSPPTSPPSEQY